jgi:transcriptional regulator with XRE-family HTH domain
MTFGERLKRRRLKLNISAGELASLIGKNRATIYRYEKGDIGNIPVDIIDPLAEALDTTPEYLMGWTDSEEVGTRIEQGKKTTIYVAIQVTEAKQMEKWIEELGRVTLTDEEFEKIIEYGKFLLYMREEDK